MRALQRAGWYEDRQGGSHKQLRHADRPGTVTIPIHAGRILKPGTLGGILREARLTGDELRALL